MLGNYIPKFLNDEILDVLLDIRPYILLAKMGFDDGIDAAMARFAEATGYENPLEDALNSVRESTESIKFIHLKTDSLQSLVNSIMMYPIILMVLVPLLIMIPTGICMACQVKCCSGCSMCCCGFLATFSGAISFCLMVLTIVGAVIRPTMTSLQTDLTVVPDAGLKMAWQMNERPVPTVNFPDSEYVTF